MKRKVSLIMAAAIAAATVTPVSAVSSLADVKGHWAEKAINSLIYAGSVNGYPDGSFKPDNKINVDEFLVIVAKALGNSIKNPDSGYWAQGYVNWAIQNEIIVGNGISEYARPITREEMCMIIANAYKVEEEEDIFKATDSADIDESYAEYVKKAYNAKIITGYEDGSIKPKGNLTRGEACQVIKQAIAYDPDEKLPFEYKKWDVAEVRPEDEDSPWGFYLSSSSNDMRDQYNKVEVNMHNETLASVSVGGGLSTPNANWNPSAPENGITIVAEKSANVSGGKGDVIISFTAPKGGNYKFNIDCDNVGKDVKGGDGGRGTFTFYRPNDNYDITSVASFAIPVSSSKTTNVKRDFVIKLKRGESVNLRFGVNVDGYGDKFVAKYTVETTEEEGKIYNNTGMLGYLATPPDEQLVEPAPYREGLVWVAADGGWFTSEPAKEVVEVLEKYIPNMGNVVLLGQPEDTVGGGYWAEKGIPTFIQNFGDGSAYKYFSETDAWEYTDSGAKCAPGSGIDLGGTGHAASLPSKEVYDWSERLARSASLSGFGGYGYMDFVWMWGAGRGNAGHNPKTIESFRRSLKGEDEGIRTSINGEPEVWHFADYAKFYTGTMLEPEDLGFSSWDEYSPLNYNQKVAKKNEDTTPHNMLFDMLMTYELYRLAQHFCDTSGEYGGITQILPNPEDSANGNDFLFLSSMSDLELATEEYFQDTEYLDGAYYRFGYLTSKNSENCSPGIVMECGGGGNAGTYYDMPVAYATAYELKAATDITHLETDFMYQVNGINATTNGNKFARDRLQAIMCYARGFIDAQQDDVKRVESDFTSVTSRKIHRPWGEYRVWHWFLDWTASPDALLAQNGYIFDSVGEEGVFDIAPNQEIVLYSPDRTMKYCFDEAIRRTKEGEFKKLLTNGPAIRQIVDDKWNLKDMKDVYAEYAFEKNAETALSGNLTDSEGNVLLENVAVESTTVYANSDYETVLSVGETPVLVKKNIGDGDVYVYCMDPNDNAVYDISKAVYDYMLSGAGIKHHFETVEATGALKEGYVDRGELAAKGKFGENASVRLYENSALKVVGVQNPLSRDKVSKADMKNGWTIAYELDNAKTTVKARLEPNVEYHYVALPSSVKGTTVSDENGFAEFSFEGTGHEIFYCLPASTENDVKISEIAARLLIWHDAMSYNGKITMNDEVAPATTVKVEGNCTDDVYTGEVKVTLSAADTDNGSGVRILEYSVDGGAFADVTNRSVIEGGYVDKTITLSGSGKHTVEYRATDARGNVEKTGFVNINIK